MVRNLLLLFCSIALANWGFAVGSATPSTRLGRLSNAMKAGDFTLARSLADQLTTEDFSETVISTWLRSTVSLSIPIVENDEVLLTATVLPPSFSLPLHTRPGKVLTKLICGSVRVRELDVLQFVDSVDLVSTKPSFFYEDAFAGGEDEDCVCRGGRCPRREGCIFWVNKRLRDSAASLVVQEKGFSELPMDSSVFFDTEAGPREFINCFTSSSGSSYSSDSGSSSTSDSKVNNDSTTPASVVRGRLGVAVLFEALLKDEEVVGRGAGIVPDIQYYQADRVDSVGVKGAKLRVTAVNDPLGVVPMYVPWRGDSF